MSSPIDQNPNLPVPYYSNGFSMMAATGPGPGNAGFATPEPTHPTPWFLDFVGVFRRHTWLIILAACACAAAAYLISPKYKTDNWAIEGKLRFMKPAAAESGKVHYDSMSISAYADLLTADETLRQLLTEFGERLPPGTSVKALQNHIKVDATRMGDIIELKWETGSPQLAIDIVNRLMTLQIENTNQLRRSAILTHAAEMLKHRIVDCDAQVNRLKRTVNEYQSRLAANPAVEKLEKAELDSYFAQRRKSILDLIQVESSRAREARIELEAKRLKFKRAESYYEKKFIPEQEVIDAKVDYQVVRDRIDVMESNIKKLEEQYREIPIEYANKKITDLEIEKAEAEFNLTTLELKLAIAKEKGISPVEVDTHDADWTKLRKWLMGPDSPEFTVIKLAGWPTAPAGSNRKMLVAAGVAAPLGALLLLLGFVDWCRGVNRRPAPAPVPANVDLISPPVAPARTQPTEESALLSMRIQQWCNESSANGTGAAESPAKPWKPLTVERK